MHPSAAVRRILALVAVALLASGCLRFRGDLVVGADERVSGTLVFALKTESQDPAGNVPNPDALPADLRDKVTLEPYNEDGYEGITATLHGLTFAELDRLLKDSTDQAAASGQPGATASPGPGSLPVTTLSMRPDGDRVVLVGQFFFPDFSLLGAGPVDGFDARMRITFPGDVVSTNGSQDGRTVTWTLRPSTVELLQATAYLGGSGGPAGWLRWGGAGLAALLLGGLGLLLARRRRPAPVGPAGNHPVPDSGGTWPSPTGAYGQPGPPGAVGRPDDWVWAQPDRDGPVGLGTPPSPRPAGPGTPPGWPGGPGTPTDWPSSRGPSPAPPGGSEAPPGRPSNRGPSPAPPSSRGPSPGPPGGSGVPPAPPDPPGAQPAPPDPPAAS